MIFPDWGAATETAGSESLPLYTEWALDADTGALRLRDGKPYTVTGAEALRVWIYLALQPDSRRYQYSAHSANYGNELETLAGESDRGILASRLRREVRETLCASPYISDVEGFSFTFTGSTVTAAFTVHTVYEDIEMTWEGEL
jgi:hypothetical protein